MPDVETEALQVLKDMITGSRPSTVLGVLLDRRRTMEMVTIAGLIGTPLTEVEWTVAVLEKEGFCESYEEEGVQMVRLVAAWDQE